MDNGPCNTASVPTNQSPHRRASEAGSKDNATHWAWQPAVDYRASVAVSKAAAVDDDVAQTQGHCGCKRKSLAPCVLLPGFCLK